MLKKDYMSKFNFYFNKYLESVSEIQKEYLQKLYCDAKYIRIFDKEDIVLAINGKLKDTEYKYSVKAYSFTSGDFKYEVEFEQGYFPLYFSYVGINKKIAIICKTKPLSVGDAIEYEIDVYNGKIINTRTLPCNESILIADFTKANNQIKSVVSDLTIDNACNKVRWIFKERPISVKLEQKALEAVYSDFQETIVIVAEDEKQGKGVYLYNLDGSYRLKIEIPQGYKLLSHPPCFNHSVEGYALTLLLHNPLLSDDALLYMIVPDNGDLVYKGITR